jgi:uncharacterized OB-fold protein
MDDKPTEITIDDIEKYYNKIMTQEIKKHTCLKCSKKYFPNYHEYECDECFFSRFPKEIVSEYYRSFF